MVCGDGDDDDGDEEEEEETSQSPFGKAQGRKYEGLPSEPCDKNQNKLIHDQFIYSDDQEISAAWNSSVHHGCHKTPQMNHDLTQSSSHHHTLFGCLAHVNFNITFLSKPRVPASEHV